MDTGDPLAMLAALMTPFAAALIAPVAFGRLGHRAAWLLSAFPAMIFLYFVALLPDVASGRVLTGGYAWVPSLDLTFSWFVDGLSLIFALLISGIGTLVALYAGVYMKGHPRQGRFFSVLFLFMGAMLGVVLSDSVLMLFVYWELTSIASFLLIGFEHERQAARRAALQALVITGGGGLCLLAGVVLLWNVNGLTQLSQLVNAGDVLRASAFYPAVLLLVLGAALTKSAQFPFHVWLPDAMEAPTPVSAYLHSATMVKAGVYLLMRLQPALGGTVAWEILLPLFGGVTLVAGALLALRQTDLKLMLAHSTVSSLGLLVMLTGFGSPHALQAAVLYLVAHALFKGALFMVAGIIDHETGSRDVTRLGGLLRAMPLTFAVALMAAVSMGGLPPFLGFLSKEEIYSALAGADPRSLIFVTIAVLGNAIMFAIGFTIALKPFAGQNVKTPRTAHEPPLLLWIGPAVLALTGLIAAVFSSTLHTYVSMPMVRAVAGEPRDIEVSLLPHPGLPLALSALTVLLGIAVFVTMDRVRSIMEKLGKTMPFAGKARGFDLFMSGLVIVAVRVTRTVQGGRLDVHVAVTFVLLAATLLVPQFFLQELPDAPVWPAGGVRLHEAAFLLMAVGGVIAVLLAKNRLTAIVSLGIQGFAVAVIFLLFGAPDLAFTQFLVETLSVVILTLVMTRVRLAPGDRRPAGRRIFDAAVAIACGLGLTLMLLKSTQGPFDNALTLFFNAWSKTIAHGDNVVNVIIVDFRGTDTLGEIAVVTIAGLAILALIATRARKDRPAPPEHPGF